MGERLKATSLEIGMLVNFNGNGYGKVVAIDNSEPSLVKFNVTWKAVDGVIRTRNLASVSFQDDRFVLCEAKVL